jgi:transcriptional regulator with XRE-family HTH domain
MYLDSSELIARIRELRNIKGITAARLGEMSGVHRSAIAKLENGLRDLRYDEAVALATALDIDLRTLISDAPLKVATEVHII